MSRRPVALLPVICALLVTGCASAPAVRLPRAGPQTTCITPRTGRDVAIGVAASGGGSRAAMLTAAGLEALATWRHLGSFRFLLNSALMARSLGEVFADRLLTRMTLEDLPPARCGAIARA